MLYTKNDNGEFTTADEDDVIYEAVAIYNRYFAKGELLTSPEKAKEVVKLKLASYDHEVFFCVFLDTRHRIIHCEALFQGTIDRASVYSREVVKAALQYNASRLIFAHNHPTGIAEPSEADKQITEKLKQALSLVDIQVLDHLIVGESVFSFAENGLI